MPPFYKWLHRVFPIFKVSPHPTEGLWISGNDGQALREIGHVDAKLGGDERGALQDLTWLSDGKRLSFRYNGALWTVPVN
jgi:hypothetical protein